MFGYKRFRPPPPVTTVTLERTLEFLYTDFNDHNFMFDLDALGRTRLYIIDFEHASFLPISFLSFVVLNPLPHFFLVDCLADRLGSSLPQNHLEVMRRISYIFQISVPTIGFSQEQLETLRAQRRQMEQEYEQWEQEQREQEGVTTAQLEQEH